MKHATFSRQCKGDEEYRQRSGSRLDQMKQKEIRYKQKKCSNLKPLVILNDHYVSLSLWVEISSMVMKRHQGHIIQLQEKKRMRKVKKPSSSKITFGLIGNVHPLIQIIPQLTSDTPKSIRNTWFELYKK